MAYAIERGLRRFDFTIGDEHYKDEWCDQRLDLFDYSAAATWRGLTASATSKVRRSLKRFIKQTPPLWRLVTRLRSSFGKYAPPPARTA
jgi:CelD/BcsL family acetyltransferase involved in cellulose biosynthesis